jgi:hypothetical protein
MAGTEGPQRTDDPITQTQAGPRGRTAGTANRVGDQLHRLREELGSYAKEKAAAARDQASNLVDDQKSAAAEGLTDVSEALRQASAHLSNRSQAVIAGLAQTAADQVESVAMAVRQRDLGELIEDTRQFALRQPGLCFMGAMLVGFLFTRIVRSSGAAPQSSGVRFDTPAGV